MKSNRHLDGIVKAEIIYDFKYDTFTFKVKNRDYKKSIEFQNFIIDIDNDGYIYGMRILDASKVYGVNKLILKNVVHGEFKAIKTDKNVLAITFKFVARLRNKIFPIFAENQNFTQQITTPISPNQDISVQESPIVA